MDASSTRPARSVAGSLRSRSGTPVRASAAIEVAPTRAISPPSALDSSQNDLDQRPGGGGDRERDGSPPLTDPVGRALLDVLANDETKHHPDTQSALLRAKAYARSEPKPAAKLTADG